MALSIRPPDPPMESLQEDGKSMSDSSAQRIRRRLPIGAEVLGDGEVHFRVWAPRSQEVEVVVDGAARDQAIIRLDAEADGYFSLRTAQAKAGDLYRYRLDEGATALPDPVSRFQSEGPLGLAPEPLLASPAGSSWRLLWPSEDPRYGGTGAAPSEDESRWFIPGKAAFLLAAEHP
jgi:1,4-alpha-glucan branching enzyme